MTDGLILPSVPCTRTSMCLSLCRPRTYAYRSLWCYLNLDSSMWIQCRQWQMSQTRWRLAHWRRRQRHIKISLWHRAGLRKWYPTAGRCQVMVHIDRRHPVRRISWALNLGLDRKLLICINLCGYRSHWGSGNSLTMAKRPLIRGSSLPLQGLANGTL